MRQTLSKKNKIPFPVGAQGDQERFYLLNSRFSVGVIGRQYGKTTLAQYRMTLRIISERKPYSVYWWISPTIAQARVVFKRYIRLYADCILPKSVNRTYQEVQLLTGATIAFKGSDKPDNLRGESLNGAILDECGQMKEEVWSEIIRPMLGTTNGWVDFIGTPKGKNWFFGIVSRAKAGEKDYSFHHASSDKSPFFSKDEFEKARSELPERVFRQEYLAEFLDFDSEVFRNVQDCIRGKLEDPVSGRRYVIGLDIAKRFDFTVLTAWDQQRKCLVGFERFNEINYNTQIERITAFTRKWNNGYLIMDSTGVGDPIYDRLDGIGLSVKGVQFTQITKEYLITALSIAIEKREISFPDIPELTQELYVFSAEKTPSGKIRYSAPSGYHDDIVISMALAVSEITESGNYSLENRYTGGSFY